MLIFRNYLRVVFFVFVSVPAFAQADSPQTEIDSIKKESHYSIVDTSLVVHREFAADQVQKLKSDRDLNYEEPPTVAENLWDRFKRWLGELISSLLRGATSTNIGQLIMFGIGGVLLIAIIMTLMKVNAFRVFMSGGDTGKGYFQPLDENIHTIDFEKMITEATERKDFRSGTRLIFLYALKILSDQHLIDWNPGKTNHDYVEELQRMDLKSGFNDLSIYFDYAWYGNFNMTAESFRSVQSVFNNWREQVKE